MALRTPQAKIEAIQAGRRGGMSILDLMLEFDVSDATVLKYTRGIPSTARRGPKFRFDHGRARVLRKQGLSYRVIGHRLGVTEAAAWKAVNYHQEEAA